MAEQGRRRPPPGRDPFTRGGPLTTEECVAAGGHCWVDDYGGAVLTDAVLGGASHKSQQCKHCPATRTGVSRSPWEWTYPEGQP